MAKIRVKKKAGNGTPKPVAYNPNDKEFNEWYVKNTLEGQSGIPYDPNNENYDYYSFFKNKGEGNITEHFPDTYKRPKHPSFSNESIYYKPGMKAGRWEGETYIPIGGNEQPQQQQLKRNNMATIKVKKTTNGEPPQDRLPRAQNPFDINADVRDILSNFVGSGVTNLSGHEEKLLFNSLIKKVGQPMAQRLASQAILYNQRPEAKNLSPEARVTGFYTTGSNDPELSAVLRTTGGQGMGALHAFRNSPLWGNSVLQEKTFTTPATELTPLVTPVAEPVIKPLPVPIVPSSHLRIRRK